MSQEKLVEVCHGGRCIKSGAKELFEIAQNKENVKAIKSPCMGRCAFKPVVIIDGKVHKQMNSEKLNNLI